MTHEQTTRQTKSALAASLKKFMARKPLSKITVSEIIADCNVNRKTFYYHFSDIYALLKWMLEQEAIEVVRNFDLLIDFEDAIRFIISYVKSNAHILNCAYDSIGRDEMKRFFYNDFIEVVRGMVAECERENGIAVTDDFRDFICRFLTEAVVGMLVSGFHDKEQPDQEMTIRHLAVLVDSLPDILRRAPRKE